MNEEKYTAEQNEELIETIRNPRRYYRISIFGRGGEYVYARLTKEQYEYWNDVQESIGDSKICEYVFAPDEAVQLHQIPPAADFLNIQNPDEHAQEWFEMGSELFHLTGCEIGSSTITVEEIEAGRFDAEVKDTLVDNNYLEEYCSDNDCIEAGEFDLDELADEDGHNRTLFLLSLEKGEFFTALVETEAERFNPAKLKITVTELPNGDTVVNGIEYNGEDVVECGGDTVGKGMIADVFDY